MGNPQRPYQSIGIVRRVEVVEAEQLQIRSFATLKCTPASEGFAEDHRQGQDRKQPAD